MRRARTPDPSRLLDAGLVLVAVAGALVLLWRLAGVAFGLHLVTFETGSMTPAFPQGSVAIAQQVPLRDVRVGDVVTVDRTGRLPITHRVVAMSATGSQLELTLRGDANRHPDPHPYVVDHLSRMVLALPAPLWWLRMIDAPGVSGAAALLATLAVAWALWPRRQPAGAPAAA